jgi:hypothetical protein
MACQKVRHELAMLQRRSQPGGRWQRILTTYEGAMAGTVWTLVVSLTVGDADGGAIVGSREQERQWVLMENHSMCVGG